MCRNFVIFSLVFLAVSSSLWAFPGRVTGSQEESTTDISAAEVRDEEQKTGSGTAPENMSTEHSQSSMASSVIEEKVNEGRRLNNEDALALYDELVEVKANLKALRSASEDKDRMIDELAKDAAEAGSKGYIFLDGILGFDEWNKPEYGIGLMLGARIGNSLMLNVGADYMIGGSLDNISFGLDRFTFRAGVGWMF